MCKQDSCCDNPWSSSLFCHKEYLKLGDAVESACYHCCTEEDGGPKETGPAPVENPDFAQLVSCDTTENPERMCKEDSCCEASGSHTDWCQEQYALFPNDNEIASICVSFQLCPLYSHCSSFSIIMTNCSLFSLFLSGIAASLQRLSISTLPGERLLEPICLKSPL